MMENKKDKLDLLLDFLMPLVKENLGGSHAKNLKDALMDYKGFVDLLGSRWQSDHLTALEDRLLNYKIVQIICSFYTLDVDFGKEAYWKSCYDRDFKEPVMHYEGEDQELNDVIAKSMNALDEYSATLLTLRNTHRASDAEIAHILEIPLNEVDSALNKAFELLVVEMKNNGVEITD
jgi:hypothetical protein